MSVVQVFNEVYTCYTKGLPFDYRITYDGSTSHIGRVNIENPWLLLGGTAVAYTCLVAVGKLFPKMYEPFLGLWKAHNLALCLFSAWAWLYTLSMMREEDHFDSLYSAACKPLKNPSFQYVSFAFLISKVWEWFDSVLLVAKGKKLRFLHCLHHATTFWLYAVDHQFLSSIKWGVMINAFIHTVMYAHYFKPFPPSYRQIITQLQIVQFMMCVFLHSYTYYLGCDQNSIKFPMEYATPYFFVIPYLLLFINFYIQQYMKQKTA